MRKITFYREYELFMDKYPHSLWYANVLGVAKEDNLMVEGADALLEGMAYSLDLPQRTGKLELFVSADDADEGVKLKSRYVLQRIAHDSAGATYKVRKNCDGNDFRFPDTIWLCNVVHKVLEEHPKYIYIYDYKKV